jgi:hypothetical protein
MVKGSRYIKFKNIWLKVKRFCRLGEIVVGLILVSRYSLGTPCYVFDKKLKQLKLDLKRLNKEVFGNVDPVH